MMLHCWFMEVPQWDSQPLALHSSVSEEEEEEPSIIVDTDTEALTETGLGAHAGRYGSIGPILEEDTPLEFEIEEEEDGGNSSIGEVWRGTMQVKRKRSTGQIVCELEAEKVAQSKRVRYTINPKEPNTLIRKTLSLLHRIRLRKKLIHTDSTTQL